MRDEWRLVCCVLRRLPSAVCRHRSMTTIALDYTPAIRQQAGIGRIIRGQVAALIAENPGFDLRLFVTGPVSATERESAPLPLHSTPWISERNLVRLWHRLDLPWPPVEWLVRHKIDLLHATDFVLPPSHARHKLLTVHDLAFVHYPEAALPGLHHYLNTVVPRSVRRAHHILADSQHTATDLSNLWGVDPNTISVVQGAVDHAHFRPVTNAAQLTAVRQKYGIGESPVHPGAEQVATAQKLRPADPRLCQRPSRSRPAPLPCDWRQQRLAL